MVKELSDHAFIVLNVIARANPFRGRGADLALVCHQSKDLTMNALVVLRDRRLITMSGTYIRPTQLGIQTVRARP